MQMLGRVHGIRCDVEALEEIERQQRGKPLGRRLRLVDRVTAIGGRERLTPFAVVGGQITARDKTVGPQPLADRVRDAAAIEQIWLFAQLSERSAEIGLAKALARQRERAAGGKDAMPLGVRHVLGALAYRLAYHVGDRKAVQRIVKGGLEQSLQRAGPE